MLEKNNPCLHRNEKLIGNFSKIEHKMDKWLVFTLQDSARRKGRATEAVVQDVGKCKTQTIYNDLIEF